MQPQAIQTRNHSQDEPMAEIESGQRGILPAPGILPVKMGYLKSRSWY